MYSVIIGIQCASIIMLLIECWIVMKHAKTMLHGFLALSCISTVFNNLGYLVELMSRSQEAYFAALRLSYMGRIWISFALLMFIAELTRSKFIKSLKYVFAAINGAVYIAMFTTMQTGLYYKNCGFEMHGDFPMFIHDDGIMHQLWSAVIFVQIIIGLYALFSEQHKENDANRRRQLFMVICAVLVQSVAVILQLLKVIPISYVYDLTMLGYPIGTVFMFVAIKKYDLLDAEVIARQFIINQLSEAIIAVDRHGVPRFYNEPARQMTPHLGGSLQSVLEVMQQSLRSEKPIRVGNRIYTAKENMLILQGKNMGKIYALVDSTDAYRYMDEIKEQRRLAFQANKAKSAFLANMSHEIRTPINSILGMDEMIMRESSEDEIIEYAENIESAGRHLLSIINDILDISKIEEGKLEIIEVDYDLTSVINDLVNTIQMRADSKGLLLKLDVDGEIPKMLHGDEIRIKQVAFNILTNAVKYTEKGSVTMNVSYEKVEDEPESILLRISVTDTGIGIKEEDLPKMFKAFERIEESRNRSIEGTGLGMSISKRLLNMMGGSLEIESEYGKGSTFAFTVKQRVVQWEPVGHYEDSYKRAVEGRKKYRTSFIAPEARVLVIDDTPMNLSVFKGLLKQTRVKIDTAASGDEGIEYAKEHNYDIIFIDHMMPHKDGVETLAEIKAMNVPSSGAVTVCLTANAISGAREKYLAAGFDDYLSKPIEANRLEHMIMDYLPDEKVQEVSASEAESSSSGEIPKWLYGVGELDIQVGLRRCGTVELYLETLGIYAGMVKENADEIENYLKAGDVKNATIKIHALKSTSRAIGAVSLGDLAEMLEDAGNENDVETLERAVPGMLRIYRGIGEALGKIEEDKKEAKSEDAEKQQISGAELKEAFTAIGEFMSVADYDSALQLIEKLSDYNVPEKEKERCDALRKAADGFMYEKISELLKEGE